MVDEVAALGYLKIGAAGFASVAQMDSALKITTLHHFICFYVLGSFYKASTICFHINIKK